jgi:glycosyltransferase involved in cell wall biosynthesis
MDKVIKVLSLVPYKFLPPDMGGQKGIAFFNRYLSKELNFQCISTAANESASEDYRIHTILSNSKFRYINPFSFFTLRKIIRNENTTHCIIEHPYFGWLGILLKWFCHVKIIIHSHNIEALRFKSINKWWWGILWHYEKMVHRHADHNFFIHDADKAYAIENYKLDPLKCTTITYGFEYPSIPTALEHESAKEIICKTHGIADTDRIMLFNGTLSYQPNLLALDTILQTINPILLATAGFQYRIIICGSKLPQSYRELQAYTDKNIVYAGFVDDINVYFKGCDILMNPVTDGGGIKTKLVEALGYNCAVVSTNSGANGISESLTNNKMLIVADGDWKTFAEALIKMDTTTATPDQFFTHFYWGKIAAKAALAIKSC